MIQRGFNKLYFWRCNETAAEIKSQMTILFNEDN